MAIFVYFGLLRHMREMVEGFYIHIHIHILG